jgi:hypothetical protein
MVSHSKGRLGGAFGSNREKATERLQNNITFMTKYHGKRPFGKCMQRWENNIIHQGTQIQNTNAGSETLNGVFR